MPSPDGRLASQIAFRARMAAASRQRRARRKAPRARPPTALAKAYTAALLELIEPLERAALARIDKIIPLLVEEAPLPRSDTRFDADASGIITRTMEGIRAQYGGSISPRTLEALAQRFGVEVSQFNRKEINRQFRSVLGIDLPGSDPFLAEQLQLFRDANVALVTRMNAEQLGKLEDLLRAAARTGSRVETIREQVQARLGVSRSRAELIARDQVLKLNGELTQLRQREAGVVEYEWVTSGDEAVRPDHAKLNGSIQRWDKPPIVDTRTGRRANPGEDFQCRCIANPVIRIGAA